MRKGDPEASVAPNAALVRLGIGLLGFSSVMTQLALMRELLGVFDGNELALGAVLGNWLLLAGIGSWLGRGSDRLRAPGRAFIAAQVLIALVPLGQVFLVRALRNVLFLRGAAFGIAETISSSLVVLLPYCLVSGYMLTLGCSLAAKAQRNTAGEADDARAIGGVYALDSLGSAVGGLLFSFVLIHWLDHFALLCLPAVLNMLAAALVSFNLGGRLAGWLSAGCACGIGCLWGTDVDGRLTALQFRSQQVLFSGTSPYGRLVVTESNGQLNFFENGVPLFSSGNTERVEESVHYGMSQRPGAEKVLLISGGFSGSAKEILKYGVKQVTYVELDPLLIELGRQYAPEALRDERIRVVATDGRLFVKRTKERFDVVLVNMPDPATSQLNRYYTTEFFQEVKQVLSPRGVLAIGLGHYENYVSPELARILACASQTLARSYENGIPIPGGRVYFLASDGQLTRDIASVLEQRGIKTQFVNRHYLAATLSPDRLGNIAAALEQPAPINRDFSPKLYFLHLLHWASQFKVGVSLIIAALGAAALLFYLVILRPVPQALFASGFAGSALEVVLLMGFQAVHGSLYRQLGIIVTLFMLGLAAGAFLMSRRTLQGGINRLALLAAAIAGLAAFMPLLLEAMARLSYGSAVVSFLAVALAPTLAFCLALVVGLQFPLASRLDSGGVSRVASRLYLADLAGACLGAFLAGTVLIPFIGLAGTCALTAGLNLLAAGRLWSGRFRMPVAATQAGG